MSTAAAPAEKNIREPSLLDALIPLVLMIALVATSIVLFGLDAAVGPLQVALLMSAVVAALVAHKNGHSLEKLGEEVVKGISLGVLLGTLLVSPSKYVPVSILGERSLTRKV